MSTNLLNKLNDLEIEDVNGGSPIKKSSYQLYVDATPLNMSYTIDQAINSFPEYKDLFMARITEVLGVSGYETVKNYTLNRICQFAKAFNQYDAIQPEIDKITGFTGTR